MPGERRGGFAGGYVAGFLAVVRGAGTIAGAPELWPFAIAPVLVALLAFAIGVVGAVWGVGHLGEVFLKDWTGWLLPLRWLLLLVAYVIGILVALVAAKVVVLPIVGGPFMEMLSERVELHASGRTPPRESFGAMLRDAMPAVWRGVATALFTLAILIVAALLALMPVVGLVALVLMAYCEALAALDATFGRKRLSLSAKRAWLRRHRAAALGLGTAVLIGNLVPLLNLLVVPWAVTGGTLLAMELPGIEGPEALPTERSDRQAAAGGQGGVEETP